MMDHLLNHFLWASKAGIQEKSIDLLVVGNDAADLDSMASAIAYAYARDAMDTGTTVVPFIPIAKADFKLRTEAVYMFETAGIDTNHLVFTDDMTLGAAFDRITSVALVDHNTLSSVFSGYENKVTAILDHHQDEACYPEAFPRIIESVGSAATLVGEMMLCHCPDRVDEQIALLLAGTILLDTVNLDYRAGRVTPKDETVAGELMARCPVPRETLFTSVQDAKFDTEGFDTRDLLRKDYKAFTLGDLHYGIASVPLCVGQWLKQDATLCREFEAFARRHRLDVLLSMNIYADPDFQRDLVMYCIDHAVHDALIGYLGKQGLGLSPIKTEGLMPCQTGRIDFYRQKNLNISRKKITHMLAQYTTPLK